MIQNMKQDAVLYTIGRKGRVAAVLKETTAHATISTETKTDSAKIGCTIF